MYPTSSAGMAATVEEMAVAHTLSRVLTSRSTANLAVEDLRRTFPLRSGCFSELVGSMITSTLSAQPTSFQQLHGNSWGARAAIRFS